MNNSERSIIDPQKQSVGIIGLGIIGSRIAEILRRSGVSVFVWNRSPLSEPNFLSSPKEVAEAADIIQIFVSDGVALMEVLYQLSPSLTARHYVLNHATVSPKETLQAAELVEKRGAQFLDAPFTGSRDAAAVGKLVYFIGGSPEVLKKVTPILEISSSHILMMGPIGAATYIKIANNLIMGVQVQALAEALELLNLGGVPLHRLTEAFQYSAGCSELIATKMLLMLQGDFEPRFSTKNMFKDLQFALDITRDHDITLPATKATAASLSLVMDAGLGDTDYSALATHYNYPGKEKFVASGLSSPSSQKDSKVSLALSENKDRKSFLKRFFNCMKK